MDHQPHRPLFGLVLAGGRSVRMGSDKAALVLPDGRTLARKCHDLLRAAGCEMVAFSLRQDQEIPGGLPVNEDVEIVRDPAGGSFGPLAGMVAGLRLRPDADWLVVACDLPRLDERTLVQLVASRRPEEKFLAYRSEHDGRPEPLCALYGPVALPVLEQALAGGLHSPARILLDNGCRLLEPVTPGALDNANTPGDWDSIIGDTSPGWPGELLEIWISSGNDFRGRHEKGRLAHGIMKVSEIECVAGMGLRGDRYFGYKPDFKGQVTFFDAATVQAVREHFSLPELPASVFRRNLIVRGVELKKWAGKCFRFQGIDFEATEECKPCYWMDRAVAPGAEEFLKPDYRGGLRAKILSDGVLRVS